MDKTKLLSRIERYFAGFARKPGGDVLAEYVRQLGDLDDDQVEIGLLAAVDEAGEHPLPVGRLRSLCIAEYASYAASQRLREADDRQERTGRRYTCARCEDTGIVEIWNPVFLEAYRGRWMALQLDGDRPPEWLGVAYRWWLRHPERRGPMKGAARCGCSCDRSRRLAAEQDDFASGNRKPNRPPACGMWTYRDGVTPLATDDAAADLQDHYAS